MVLFPFREYIWFYAGFLLFVLAVLALDLGVFHRRAHVIGMREAVGLSIFWITLALLFNFGFYLYCKHEFSQNLQLMALSGFDPERQARYSALEFLTGFIVEKSLAVDNLFIFVVLFRFFSIPAQSQHKILFWGILEPFSSASSSSPSAPSSCKSTGSICFWEFFSFSPA